MTTDHDTNSASIDHDTVEVSVLCYRSSQYRTAAEADAAGALRLISVDCGCAAAANTLWALCDLADLMDHRAAEQDLRAIITLALPDGSVTTLPECALSDASFAVLRWASTNR